jgi:prefoldin subunit 5
MSRSKYGKSTLSGLIDSDSEDTQFVEAMPTPDSATESRGAAKKGRGRAKVAPGKVTKTKAPARRLSGRLIAKGKAAAAEPAPAKSKRKALADKTNQQGADDTEEVDEFGQNEDTEMGDELDVTAVAVKENKPQAAKKMTTSGRGITKKKAPAKRAAPIAKAVNRVVLESQVPDPEIQNTQAEEEVETPIEKAVQKPVRAREHSHARQLSRQPSQQRRRAGSIPDTERGDPILRRKLGDITKKYETVNVRYQDVREIGMKEAERNVERLRKRNEEEKAGEFYGYDTENIYSQDADAQKLIASLKSDLAAHSSSTNQCREMKKKVQSQTTEISDLRSQLAELNASVAQFQSENKSLSAKLAASRTAAAEIASKAPNTAVKPNGGIRMMGGADPTASLKENLYSDLTGLIIRSVKQEAEDDVFDCIQTARNRSKCFRIPLCRTATNKI